MASVIVAPSHENDATELAESVPHDTASEFEEFGFPTMKLAIEWHMLHSSSCWTLRRDGKLLWMFGLIRVNGSLFSAWGVDTEAARRHGKTLVKTGRAVVSNMLKIYGPIVTCFDSRHAASARFLRALGFAFVPSGAINMRHSAVVAFRSS